MVDWMAKNLGALLMAGGLLVNVGVFMTQVQVLGARVDSLEKQVKAEHDAAAATFSRRDVLDALLVSINQRLANIENDVRDIKQRQ